MTLDPQELRLALQALNAELQQDLRANFGRSLPFPDALLDRWERAQRLGFGSRSSVYDSAVVFGDVEVGEQTWVGPQVMLDGSGGLLRIGRYCSISAGVQIYTHDTVKWALTGGKASARKAPVAIGDCCHIGAQSIVLAGVSIGQRCVVAANSVVTRDIPSNTIVAGSPASRIGKVSIDDDNAELVYDRHVMDGGNGGGAAFA